ncbi:unnamed protein product [Pleuronectes platessa]|uniref:Low-density lipoprotein receptor domain class A n=1 Tax=Pleuronectes platessa TaxID=8262 RepID=A0A9N7YVR2_PLEPL|nr:unnamed protein product [Pleuronectes platessa]
MDNSMSFCCGTVTAGEDVISSYNSSHSIMQFNLEAAPKALTCPTEYQPALDKLKAIVCDIGEFHCHDKSTCVPEAWLCDGEPDCPDDSDETGPTCKSAIASIPH